MLVTVGPKSENQEKLFSKRELTEHFRNFSWVGRGNDWSSGMNDIDSKQKKKYMWNTSSLLWNFGHLYSGFWCKISGHNKTTVPVSYTHLDVYKRQHV